MTTLQVDVDLLTYTFDVELPHNNKSEGVNHTFYGANTEHRNESVHDLEMPHVDLLNCLTDCMAFGIILFKPHIGHTKIIQFRHKELCYNKSHFRKSIVQ